MQPMADHAVSIGAQLRVLRDERDLTQEGLAAAAAVSVDLIKKLEQGKRHTARLTSLVSLANALDVPLSQLMDKRPRLNGHDRLVLGLRDAVLSTDELPGLDLDDAGEPTPLPVLGKTIERAWAGYWGGTFTDLARAVPALVGEARLTHRSLGVGAAQALAQSYQLAACLL